MFAGTMGFDFRKTEAYKLFQPHAPYVEIAAQVVILTILLYYIVWKLLGSPEWWTTQPRDPTGPAIRRNRLRMVIRAENERRQAALAASAGERRASPSSGTHMTPAPAGTYT
jgi:hypothetical protein